MSNMRRPRRRIRYQPNSPDNFRILENLSKVPGSTTSAFSKGTLLYHIFTLHGHGFFDCTIEARSEAYFSGDSELDWPTMRSDV